MRYLWVILVLGVLCLGLTSCPAEEDTTDDTPLIDQEGMRQPDMSEEDVTGDEKPLEGMDNPCAEGEHAEGEAAEGEDGEAMEDGEEGENPCADNPCAEGEDAEGEDGEATEGEHSMDDGHGHGDENPCGDNPCEEEHSEG
jgi:hypothetical protein